MSATPPLEEFYLDSTKKVRVDRVIYRTAGMEQRKAWSVSGDPKPEGEWIQDRSCRTGAYEGVRYFSKTPHSLPDDFGMSVREFIEHHARRLHILDAVPYAPKLMFYTGETVAMRFFDGRNVKDLTDAGDWNAQKAEYIFPLVMGCLADCRRRLIAHKIFYDAGWNNIMIAKDNRVMRVDFDVVKTYRPLCPLAFGLLGLAFGLFAFNEGGRIYSVYLPAQIIPQSGYADVSNMFPKSAPSMPFSPKRFRYS